MPEFEEDAPRWMRVMMLLATVAAVALVAGAACNATQLTQVQDASNKRETICRFVEAWAPGQPELKRLDELCKVGADLKEIAAAYAECPAGKAEQ
jgi:uncharacterized protein (DUF2141 family)